MTAAALAALPSPAHACGGLFCSSANPVNQAAERIVFAHNPDGTITAIIQIMYEGPAHEFAWVLPIPGVPDVGVSSDQVLDALQQATNPVYVLSTVQGGTCGGGRGFNSAPGLGTAAVPDLAEPGGVTVEASGAIGPYDFAVISFDAELEDPAGVAIEWLTDNGYDVGELGPELLRPYLAEGLNLLAFRLSKGNDAGSIRPVMITYEAELPSIPIKPTAVAANDDMGVLVWVLGSTRAVPENYKSLVLNEALLDWFNPGDNYNEVVTRAADEAMGQGFVTEYAGRHADLGFAVFPPWMREAFRDFAARASGDPVQAVAEAIANWGSYDGFDDALRASLTLPDGVSYENFRNCPSCYGSGGELDVETFLRDMNELVIGPLIATQDLFDSRPYMTRLYTTMSADEMTRDPVFAFNADLGDVSNRHVAEQTVDCDGDDWTVTLPQGGTVRGYVAGTWPVEVDDAPAALTIAQLGTEGQGRVVEDRTTDVLRTLKTVNARTRAAAIASGDYEPSDGCAAHGSSPAGAWPGALVVALLLAGRRRRRRAA